MLKVLVVHILAITLFDSYFMRTTYLFYIDYIRDQLILQSVQKLCTRYLGTYVFGGCSRRCRVCSRWPLRRRRCSCSPGRSSCPRQPSPRPGPRPDRPTRPGQGPTTTLPTLTKLLVDISATSSLPEQHLINLIIQYKLSF